MENPETKLTTLADRLREAFGADKPPTVAAKLSLAGFAISYQAIYKWLDGGNVSDTMIEGVAQVYSRDQAWLKYGSSQPPSIDRVVQAMGGMSPEKQQKLAELAEIMAGP